MRKRKVFLRDSDDDITYADVGSTDDLRNTKRSSLDSYVEVCAEGAPSRLLSNVELVVFGAKHVVAQRDRSVAGNRTKLDKADERRHLVSHLAEKHRAKHEYNLKSGLGTTRGMARVIAVQLRQHDEFKDAETRRAWSEGTIRNDLAVLGIK